MELKSAVDLINSERQAIWARNAAMLVGNSLILSAMNWEAARATPGAGILLGCAGILICGLWGVMTWSGWNWFHELITLAAEIPTEPEPNFLRLHVRPGSYSWRWTNPIFLSNLGLITVFLGVFSVSLAFTASRPAAPIMPLSTVACGQR